jgi:hypothetical protein
MAVCLDYQSVYMRRERVGISVRTQIAAAVVLLLTLGFKVWVKLESIDLGYQLAKAREIAVTLDMERRELELQRSVLSRPDALSRIAAQKLGLRSVDPRQATRLTY